MRIIRSSHLIVVGLVMLVGIPLGSASLKGQEESPYSSFDVYIYPEYEHPGVGIVVEGVVNEGKYPRYLEMQVPQGTTIALVRMGAGEVMGAGERIDILERDGKSYLPIDVSESGFQVQYYFNPFTEGEETRSFTYELSTNEVLPEFHFIIQRPIAAENFQHSLVAAEELEGDFGIVFYRQHVPGLQPQAIQSVTVSYSNPTHMLTLSRLQSMMAEQQDVGVASPVATRNPTSNLGSVLIVLLVVSMGMFMILKVMGRGKAMQPVLATQTPLDAVTGTKGKGKDFSASKFCPHCGSPRQITAKYCGQCGKEY